MADPDPAPSPLRKLLLGLGMGIPGIIAFCATVPVEQARSNLAGWLHWAGVDRVPAAFQSSQADVVGLVMSVLVTTLTLVLGYATHRRMGKVEREIEAATETLRANTGRLKKTVEKGQQALDTFQRRQTGSRRQEPPSG